MVSNRHLISQVLRTAKSERVLDLGCGSGELAHQLASQGYDVVAVDASETALAAARTRPVPANLDFVQADLGAIERIGRGHFGAVFCLGNTLPYLLSTESISRLFIGLKRRVLPGAPVLLQTLNYELILKGGLSARPLEVKPLSAASTVRVELMEPIKSSAAGQEGIVLHTTASLLYSPREVPSLELVETQAIQLRGWTITELQASLEVARFSVQERYGDLDGSPFDPDRSEELVILVA